ncbi:amino acid/polyamine/organocation transporter (APC superfamily) [Algoriphagus boseongensis]|uniref:Amino acid/polyamine/organocation transporter (APC superfamily) n=1 Tax=Algoriphagus boseongensis TaxID=1442587 RepID=A0A4R6T7Y4_9BACT|nr:APC family permease [Algoriphagus boseongensis]TDQ18289.1 amino acid/polyamine/organocation transporter (APC superfamily) [Algoriphagus boseongensis]
MPELKNPEDTQEKLPRNLGLWGVWMLVVNGLIGAGIFGLPSGAYALAGEYSVLIYVFCGLLMLPVILSFAEVGSYFRGTGGPIKYGKEAFGSFIGFQGGWLYYLARLISFSANTVLLTDSIAYFLPIADSGTGRLISLALTCGFLSLINILGSVESIRSMTIFTIIKFGVLIGLVFGGFVLLGSEVIPAFQSPVPDSSDLGKAALLLIYAFVGFEGAVVPAGEAKRPERDMPLGLLLGLGVVALLYILVQLVAQAAVPNLADSKAPLLDASSNLFGQTGAVILMVGVATSVLANLVSSMFSATRITYALSLEKSLPKWFGEVHSRFLTPANSVLFFGLAAFSLAAMGSFRFLAAMTVLSRLLLFIMTCASIPKLRPRFKGAGRFILKGGYIVPILGILACLWLMLQVSFTSVWLTAVLLGIGTALYWIGKKAER